MGYKQACQTVQDACIRLVYALVKSAAVICYYVKYQVNDGVHLPRVCDIPQIHCKPLQTFLYDLLPFINHILSSTIRCIFFV